MKLIIFKWPPCWPPPYIPYHPRYMFKRSQMKKVDGKKHSSWVPHGIILSMQNSTRVNKINPLKLNNSTEIISFHWKEIIQVQVAPVLAPSLYPLPSKVHVQEQSNKKKVDRRKAFKVGLSQDYSINADFNWNEIIPLEENHSTGMKLFHWNEIIPLE